MTLRLNGSTSGYVEIDAPATAGSNTIVLPSGNGSANQLLKNGSTAGSLEFSSSVYIDSSQRLLVGTSSARSNFFNSTVSASFQIEGAGTENRIASLISSNSTGDQPSILILGHQKSGAVGGNTALSSGDGVGRISYQGSDGSEFVEAAAISAEVDGTPGANDMPGRLVFSTTPDSGSSPVERLRIANNGQLSAVVPGGSTVYPGFMARAWVNFNGTGTVAIRASGNVSSITDNGTGNYTVNFATAMPDANYSVCTSSSWDTTGGEAVGLAGPTYNGQFNTSGVRISVRNPNNSGAFDSWYISASIFR